MTAEPLVINFTAADNQKLVLDYKKPRNEAEAKLFVKEQKVALKDKSSNQVVASEQFVLPKVEGFQLTRDYQQELLNMGKAFNQPATVAVSTAAVMAANSAPVQVAEQGSEQPGSPDPAAKLVQQGRCRDSQSLPDLGDPAAVMACEHSFRATREPGPLFISASLPRPCRHVTAHLLSPLYSALALPASSLPLAKYQALFERLGRLGYPLAEAAPPPLIR